MEIRNIFTQFEAKQTFPEGDSLTKQEFKKQCDINHIVASAKRNGQELLQPVEILESVGMDLTQLPDYATALNQVILAEEAFQGLDAKIRRKFNDNPANLIEFLKDPSNKEEGQKLGLIKPDPIVQPEPIQESPKA